MNQIRQTKEYYTGNKPRQVLSDVAGEYYADNSEPVENRCPLDPVEEAKILIVDKITKQFSDILFETVCEHMSDHSVFQSQTYLTEEGYEEFEDEWFEFYHEHHGDILHEVTQNITN